MHRPPTILTLVLPCPAILNCTRNNYKLDKQTTETVTPGVYAAGSRSRAVPRSTSSPGVYVLDQGNFAVSGPGTVIGAGVTIILTQPQRVELRHGRHSRRFDNRDHRTRRRCAAGEFQGSPSGSTSMRPPPAPSSMAANTRISTARSTPQPMVRYFGGSHSGNALESAGGLDRRVHPGIPISPRLRGCRRIQPRAAAAPPRIAIIGAPR